MTHCAKCGAELIGQKKFCAACGAPTTDPRAPSPQAAAIPSAPASTPGAPNRDSAYGGLPVPSVNPFAQTATPGSQRPEVYGPPPASSPASSRPAPSKIEAQVSPLAVSNVMSQRGAFDAAGGAAVQAAAQVAAAAAEPDPPKKTAGTQIMPSTANPAPSIAAAAAAAAAGPAPSVAVPSAAGGKLPRTAVMPASVAAPSGSVPKMSSAAPVAPPSHIARGPMSGQPQASIPSPGVPFKPPSAPPGYGQPALPQYAPPPPPQQMPPQSAVPSWGYPAPAYPAAPGQAPFAFVPGARVQVTWANGQRYPATVQQVAGTQCLVVFPDGRQQWVEMAYVSPA